MTKSAGKRARTSDDWFWILLQIGLKSGARFQNVSRRNLQNDFKPLSFQLASENCSKLCINWSSFQTS